jgi:hypothetical protein
VCREDLQTFLCLVSSWSHLETQLSAVRVNPEIEFPDVTPTYPSHWQPAVAPISDTPRHARITESHDVTLLPVASYALTL